MAIIKQEFHNKSQDRSFNVEHDIKIFASDYSLVFFQKCNKITVLLADLRKVMRCVHQNLRNKKI